MLVPRDASSIDKDRQANSERREEDDDTGEAASDMMATCKGEMESQRMPLPCLAEDAPFAANTCM